MARERQKGAELYLYKIMWYSLNSKIVLLFSAVPAPFCVYHYWNNAEDRRI